MKYRADKPCPAEGKWKVVTTYEGSFWRRERGTGDKEAVLNDACEAQKQMVVRLSPVAAKLVRELRPYLAGLVPRRINNRVKTCLQQCIEQKGAIDYRFFRDLIFQKEYDLWKVLAVTPRLDPGGKYVQLHVPIPEGGAVKRQSELVTSYRFVLIMVVGDPFSEGMLSTYEAASGMYELDTAYAEGCTLRLIRPTDGEPWLACLRIVTYEGEEVAISPRHSGMTVVGWNR